MGPWWPIGDKSWSINLASGRLSSAAFQPRGRSFGTGGLFARESSKRAKIRESSSETKQHCELQAVSWGGRRGISRSQPWGRLQLDFPEAFIVWATGKWLENKFAVQIIIYHHIILSYIIVYCHLAYITYIYIFIYSYYHISSYIICLYLSLNLSTLSTQSRCHQHELHTLSFSLLNTPVEGALSMK